MMRDTKYEDNMKLDIALSKFKRKCKHCGWFSTVLNKNGRTICRNCGNYVYLDQKKEDFKNKMKDLLKR